MTWIIFDNVHVWKLIHVCYFFLLFSWLSKKLSQLPNLELNSLLSRFYSSVWTKISINGVYKTNIDCSFIRGIVENYCTLGKTQPYYSPRPYSPRWIVGQGWVSPRDNNFPKFPSCAVNICIIVSLNDWYIPWWMIVSIVLPWSSYLVGCRQRSIKYWKLTVSIWKY